MSDSYDPRVQLWEPQPIMLAGLFTASLIPASVGFRVPIPDSRLRVKISVNYVPSAGAANQLLANYANLWLVTRETDRSGRRGSSTAINNLVGTSASPASIIGDASVNGMSREFVTAADEIYGRLDVESHGVPGRWMLQCRYQPEITLPCEEWEIIRAQCVPSLDGDPIHQAGTGS